MFFPMQKDDSLSLKARASFTLLWKPSTEWRRMESSVGSDKLLFQALGDAAQNVTFGTQNSAYG